MLGVGGGGSNMVNSMIDSGRPIRSILSSQGPDAQALKTAKAPHKIQLGIKSTKGLGAGANPDVGRRAAEEDIDTIILPSKRCRCGILYGWSWRWNWFWCIAHYC